MEYVKDGIKYTESEIRRLYPNTSFPEPMQPFHVVDMGFFQLHDSQLPEINAYEYIVDGDPVQVDGSWFKTYIKMDLELTTAKEFKTNEINNSCEAEIIDGIYSDADGSIRKYDSGVVDQLNFMQAMSMAQMSGTAVMYRCWKPDGSGKEWIPLTFAQFKQILIDGGASKAQLLLKCSTLKDQIEACTTIEELSAIHW